MCQLRTRGNPSFRWGTASHTPKRYFDFASSTVLYVLLLWRWNRINIAGVVEGVRGARKACDGRDRSSCLVNCAGVVANVRRDAEATHCRQICVDAVCIELGIVEAMMTVIFSIVNG